MSWGWGVVLVLALLAAGAYLAAVLASTLHWDDGDE